jgi:hypothetical protein
VSGYLGRGSSLAELKLIFCYHPLTSHVSFCERYNQSVSRLCQRTAGSEEWVLYVPDSGTANRSLGPRLVCEALSSGPLGFGSAKQIRAWYSDNWGGYHLLLFQVF